MDDRTRLNFLFDFYGVLLTDRQRELFELHYQYDLSLGEIAENFQISRQAVHDLLRRTITQMNNYESCLQLLAKFLERQAILAELESALVNSDIPLAQDLTGRLKNS